MWRRSRHTPKYEGETLKAVTEARAKVGSVQVSKDMVGNPQAMAQFQQAQTDQCRAPCQGSWSSSRSIPDLKANQNFLDLQHQLEGTENRINVARTRYNKAVQDFNTSIRIFPNSLTNSMLLHLQPKEAFKAEAGAEKAPTVKF